MRLSMKRFAVLAAALWDNRFLRTDITGMCKWQKKSAGREIRSALFGAQQLTQLSAICRRARPPVRLTMATVEALPAEKRSDCSR